MSEDARLGPAGLKEAPPPDRKPAADTWDAVVGVTPANQGHQRAFALVKFTYRIERGACEPDAAEPLAHDLRDESGDPRLVPGSDFHLWKGLTDVVVQGAAHAPGGRPVSRLDAGIDIAGRRKLVRVHGDREVSWTDAGRVRFGPAEPFEEMPLTWDRAYGGVDWRIQVPDDDPKRTGYLTESDHPGMYPRNPWGRGYVVLPDDPGERVLLPNLEDPDDPLTEERFLVGDPSRWYRQPLPWTLDWTHPYMWPRCVYFFPGVDAWHPGPEDGSMPEVRRGYLESGYRRMMAEDHPGGMHPRFVQGGSHGMVFPNLAGGEAITLWRLHPLEEQIELRLPWSRPPAIDLIMDGRGHRPEPRLHHVVLRPAERRVSMVWAALHSTPRTYLPGIHKHIPLAVQVEGSEPVHYDTPPTVREQIDKARAEAAKDEAEGDSENATTGEETKG